jgi:hypothetical protein
MKLFDASVLSADDDHQLVARDPLLRQHRIFDRTFDESEIRGALMHRLIYRPWRPTRRASVRRGRSDASLVERLRHRFERGCARVADGLDHGHQASDERISRSCLYAATDFPRLRDVAGVAEPVFFLDSPLSK